MKTRIYAVQFRARNGERLRKRFRAVSAENAREAMLSALESLRPGALPRYERRNRELVAHVADRAGHWHATGIPLCVHTFLLELGPVE